MIALREAADSAHRSNEDKLAGKERERVAVVKEREAADERIKQREERIAALERDKAATVVERDSILAQKVAGDKERKEMDERHNTAMRATSGDVEERV